MSEQTVKCPICGKPYKVYSFYAGDQSACNSCRWEAEAEERKMFPQQYAARMKKLEKPE